MTDSARAFGYFPGCSLSSTAHDYDRSVRAVARALGVELVEIPEWVCCGSTSAHAVNRDLALSLPALSLALARDAGLDRVLVPCAMCLSRLMTAQRVYETDPVAAARINEIIELECPGSVRLLNMIDFLDEAGLGAAPAPTPVRVGPVACYYGCLLIRPPEVTRFQSPESPQGMERMLRALGVETVEWNFKSECCGAGFGLTRTEHALELSGRVLSDAVKHGAKALVTACPMCHMNLDFRQAAIRKRNPGIPGTPVYFLTDLAGKALGLDDGELGIDHHWVRPGPGS